MPILTKNAPSWVYAGALYDLDFANQRYWHLPLSMRSANGSTYRMQSVGVESNFGGATNTYFRPDPSGVWKGNQAQYAPPITGYGLWSEGYNQTSNFALWCRDFTQTSWTKVNCTANKNQTGCDGTANSASSLVANSSSATALQTIAALSTGSYTLSVITKRISGTGAIYLTYDGSTFTNITSQIKNNYTQASLSGATLTATSVVGFLIATSGDSIAVDFAQLENNPVPTSPILTTNATLRRTPEGLYLNNTPLATGAADNQGYNLIHNINYGTAATVLIQYSGNFDPTHDHLIYADDLNLLGIYSNSTGANTINVKTSAGNFSSTASDVTGLYTLNKVIARVSPGGSAVCVNGGVITTSSLPYSPVDTGLTHAGFLNNGSNLTPTNGYCKRATFWNKALTDGEMINLSTVVEPY